MTIAESPKANDVKPANGRWAWIITALVGLIALAAPASYVSVTEERNVFCTSCHLKPEQTYYERSLVRSRNDALDLASAHAAASVDCVGCHRGNQGLRDRIIALGLGSRNTVKFVLGQYDPNHARVAVGFLLTDSCVRCHVAEPERGGVRPGEVSPMVAPGFENHFHTMLFDPKTKTSVTCASCHQAHREAFPELQFLDRTKIVLPVCEKCHQETGRGPASGLR